MNECMWKYIRKALSKRNRKQFDGDSNAPYKIMIEMAEVGPVVTGDPPKGNFWFRLIIPRQVDNCLGMSMIEDVFDRDKGISILRELILELEKSNDHRI